MTNLLVTTIRRNVPFPEPTGYIYLVDLENFSIIQKSIMIEPAFRQLDNNPRGGMRGSRGIALRDDQIAIANASMIFRYDSNWNLLGALSHPSMAAIHDIAFQEVTLWATAARTDLIFQFDLNGELLRHFYLRQPSPANRSMKWQPTLLMQPQGIVQGATDFRDPRTHKEETYDRAHVNSLCFTPAGEILVSMGLVVGVKFALLLQAKSWLLKRGIWKNLLAINRWIRGLLGFKKNVHSDLVVQPAKGHSAIISLSPDGAHRLRLLVENTTVPSHSLLMLSDQTCIYLNTTAGEVIHFNPDTGSLFSATKVTDGFLRGVVQLDDRRLLIGSKYQLITFDIPSRQVLSTLNLTPDPDEAVYDLKILPAHFSHPPLSFATHFYDSTGFDSETLAANSYHLSMKIR